MPAVLALCSKTLNIVEPWLENGYEAVIVDLQHPQGMQVDSSYSAPLYIVGADVLTYNPPQLDYVAAFAFPPCTDLAVSGARWFKDKGLKRLAQALFVVDRCREICESLGVPYALENPVSVLSSYWRKPDYSFNPCDYAGYLDDPESEAYTKKTCLWTGNGFVMPPIAPVQPVQGSKMHLMSPGSDRADLRSVTPRGFSKAVFMANQKFAMAV